MEGETGYLVLRVCAWGCIELKGVSPIGGPAIKQKPAKSKNKVSVPGNNTNPAVIFSKVILKWCVFILNISAKFIWQYRIGIFITTVLIVLITAALAIVENPFFSHCLSEIYQTINLPFKTIRLFERFTLKFPEYFLINFALIVSAAFMVIVIFAKKAGRAKDIYKQLLPGIYTITILGFYAIIVKLHIADRGQVIQIILFILTVLMLVWPAIYYDKKNRITLFHKNIFQKGDLVKLLIFSGAVFILYIFDLKSWKYSFIGDEYRFLTYAKNIISGAVPLRLFSENGVYNYHPVLSAIWQAAFMLPLDKGLLGWKISSAIVPALSMIPLYIWARMVFNKRVAVITIVSFVFCQAIMAFGHLGYNNIQAILPFALSLMCFEMALRKNSKFWLVLTALVLGLGYYTFYSSRLMILIICVYWFLHPKRKELSRANLFLAIGIYTALISFILFNPQFMENLLNQTVIAGSEIKNPQDRIYYVLLNFIHTFFGFLYKQGMGHYIIGGITDIVTAVGIIIALVWSLISIKQDWRARFILASYCILVFFLGAIVQYEYPPNTRLYYLGGIYAIMAGVGLTRLAALSVFFKRRALIYRTAIFSLVILISCINIIKFYFYMPDHFHFTLQSYIVKYVNEVSQAAETVLVTDRLRRIPVLAKHYKFEHRFQKIDSQQFEGRLRSDLIKNKIVIFEFEALPKKEVREFAGTSDIIKDFRGRQIIFYIYDLRDAEYYRAFKELWHTGRTTYVPKIKKDNKKRKVKSFRIKTPRQIKSSQSRAGLTTVRQKRARIFANHVKITEKRLSDFPLAGQYPEVETIKLTNIIGRKIKLNTKLQQPSDLQVAANGKTMYIIDNLSEKLLIFQQKSKYDYRLKKAVYVGEGKPARITSVLAKTQVETFLYVSLNEKKEMLYIMNSNDCVVKEYDLAGNYRGDIISGDFLKSARSIRVSRDGNLIIIANPRSNSIVTFTPGGQLLDVYATTHGNGLGQLSQPCYAGIDFEENRYIVDSSNGRIELFAADMKYKNSCDIGNCFTILGPQILIYEEDKLPFMAVTQPCYKKIMFFSLDGKKVKILALDSFSGANFKNPAPVAKDNLRNIYLLDTSALFITKIFLAQDVMQ